MSGNTCWQARCEYAPGRPWKTTVFDGAGHAFMNPNNKGGYHAEATAEAWAMIFTYLETALADEPTEQED